MDIDDVDSLFDSPPMSPKSQPTVDTASAPKNSISLCLPGMNFSSSPMTIHKTSTDSAPTQSQTTMQTSLKNPRQTPAHGLSSRNVYTPTRSLSLMPQQALEELGQAGPPTYVSPTLEALKNPTGPVRLIPTLPTGASSAPTALPPIFTSPFSPGHDFVHLSTSPIPSRTALANSPRNSTLCNDSSTVPEGATQRSKKCTKCGKDRPLSEYEHMSPMGQRQPRAQCASCREKRRVSVARSKKKKEDVLAQARLRAQHREAQDRQLEQQTTEALQSPSIQASNLPLLRNPTMAAFSPSLDRNVATVGQGSSMSAPAAQSPMLSSPTVPLSLGCGFPNLSRLKGFHPAATLASSTSLPSMAPALSSSPFASYSDDPQVIQDLFMCELDMSNFVNFTSSPLQSPSSLLPPDPIMEANTPQEQQQQTDHRPSHTFVTVKTLPISLNEAELKLFINQEMERFRFGRENCRWMKNQDEATLQQCWRKREAAIVLGLVEVPPPKLQSKIGVLRSEGSHDLLPGGNDDSHS
ncbi:hypothetical protein CT0861_03515 [Colletotrichum tofieldiae]|uniref:Uncharacterized protein n=1 Tax=Colletotrichum tofieldiae TaxID=708197 RepID=A0A161WMN1_9PEZI|nr:hypothetical protein CT0861_03515 [Colletotrichum tofieldiae]